MPASGSQLLKFIGSSKEKFISKALFLEVHTRWQPSRADIERLKPFREFGSFAEFFIEVSLKLARKYFSGLQATGIFWNELKVCLNYFQEFVFSFLRCNRLKYILKLKTILS